VSYIGDRQATVTRTVKTGSTSFQPATTTRRFDGLGRLWQVVEPSGVYGDFVTTYSFDVGSRLSGVLQEHQSFSSTSQSRTFVYDNRGFLLREQHPELGAAGNGWQSHCFHDAAGKVLRQRMGSYGPGCAAGSGPFDLELAYDRAERPVQVANGSQVLKSFAYYGAGVAPPNRHRLQTASRHNPGLNLGLGVEDVVVTEDYTWNGPGGLLSDLTTTVSRLAGVWSFGQSWGYSDLGQVVSEGYPLMTAGTGGVYNAAPARTVTRTYVNGQQTSMPGYAEVLEYHDNFMLERGKFAPDQWYSIGKADDQLQRPSLIATATDTEVLLPGIAYEYDPSGNVTKVGDSSFWYQTTGRIRYARMGNGAQQSYSYDGFGNLTYITESGGSTNIPVSSSSNRMTGGVVAFDVAGNMTVSPAGVQFSYDALGMLRSEGFEGTKYVYTPNDERIILSLPGTSGARRKEKWRLRDLAFNTVRSWHWKDQPTLPPSAQWSWERDWVYREGRKLWWSYGPVEGELRHYLDHLDSPVMIEAVPSGQIDLNFMLPYGKDLGSPGVADDVYKRFTGHVRDLHSKFTLDDDLDYMHARYYWGLYGRFLSVDPVGGDPGMPQSWNRYAYVYGNPVNFVDPYGLVPGGYGEEITVTGRIPGLRVEPAVGGQPPRGGGRESGPRGRGHQGRAPRGIETVEGFFLRTDELLEFAVCGNAASRSPGDLLEGIVANLTPAVRFNANGVLGTFLGFDGRGTLTISLKGISFRPGVGIGVTGPLPTGGSVSATLGLLFGDSGGLLDVGVGATAVPGAGPAVHASGTASTSGSLSGFVGVGVGGGQPSVGGTLGHTFTFRFCRPSR
jgi:RHS repeat-associated protein